MTGGQFQSQVDKASRTSARNAARIAGWRNSRLGVQMGTGAKAEATQRLQIGLSGLASMVLLIGLATIIGNQADQTRDGAVPQAAPTTEPTEAPTQRDPLADAGIVPDLPAETPVEEEGAVVEDLPDSPRPENPLDNAQPLEPADAP